jgi:hypothetical protein
MSGGGRHRNDSPLPLLSYPIRLQFHQSPAISPITKSSHACLLIASSQIHLLFTSIRLGPGARMLSASTLQCRFMLCNYIIGNKKSYAQCCYVLS